MHLTVCCVFNEQRNVLRKQRHWERQLAAKKSKRKEEKQRRKLNREQRSGKDKVRRIKQMNKLGRFKVKVLSLYNQITCICLSVFSVSE